MRRQMNPNSLKNLKPQEKGKPNPNAKGRPPKPLSITHIVREMLDEVCPEDKKGRKWKDYLAERWLTESLSNAVYFRELMDRLEGKVLQPVGGHIEHDVNFVIGKGYSANDKSDLQPDQPAAA